MSHHYLLLSAEIDQRIANTMVAHLTDLLISGATKLTLAISSPGGNVICGFTIYNALMSMPFLVETHNFGNVDSIANLIFQAGKKRYANASSTFMFHGVGFNGNASERLEEKNILEKLDTIRAEHKRISKTISDRSGLKQSVCVSLFKQQRTKSAIWANSNGIVDDIREFVLPFGAAIKYMI